MNPRNAGLAISRCLVRKSLGRARKQSYRTTASNQHHGSVMTSTNSSIMHSTGYTEQSSIFQPSINIAPRKFNFSGSSSSEGENGIKFTSRAEGLSDQRVI